MAEKEISRQRFGPCSYEVGRETLRRYAEGTGETHPLCVDRDAAREAGMRDLVAPPMFAAVYAVEPIIQAVVAIVGDHIGRMLHAGQHFTWGEPVCCGDRITTSAVLEEREDRDAGTFLVLGTTSHNQLGQATVEGRWTELVRGGLPVAP